MRPPTPGLQGPADLVGRTGDLLAKPEACKRSVERGHRAASSLGPWGHSQITRYMDRRALARLRGRIGCNRRLGRLAPNTITPGIAMNGRVHRFKVGEVDSSSAVIWINEEPFNIPRPSF
jgi:hypothetical protein